MKQTIIYRLLLSLMLLALVLPGCTKKGDPGPKGPTGNANVQYSPWDSTFSGTSAYWTVPAITQGVLDTSAVLVYVRQNGYVYQLPFDNVNGSSFYINDLIQPGRIALFCGTGYNLNEFAFKYVIISGSAALPSSLPRDYETLVGSFHIAP